jgi:hypothetical protein
MLCKTTIRAALAHVLATVGILGAFGAGAAPDSPYAAESFGDKPYTVKGSPMGVIVLDVELDSLLESGDLYMTVNFWTAELTEALELEYTPTPGTDDIDGVSGDPEADENPLKQPAPGKGTGFRFYTRSRSTNPSGTADNPVPAVTGTITDITTIDVTRARDGDPDDSAGVYKLEISADVPLQEVSTTKNRVRIDLTSKLKVPNTDAGSYRGNLYLYEELGDARAAARASDPDDVPGNYLVAGDDKLFEVGNQIAAPTIMPMLATANVGYERAGDEDNNVSTGGPFRGFVASTGDAHGNVGVLASITLNEAKNDPATRDVDESLFLDASDGEPFDGTVNTGANFSVTAVPGAFGFGNGAGDGPNGESKITGDDPATDDEVEDDHVLNRGGPPEAFRIATSMDCTGGKALELTVDGDAIDPLDDDPTFAAEADGGEADDVNGDMFYFCVNVSTNEVAIPTVGDDRMMDGYEMTVTALHGKTEGPSTTGAAGAIDRNGTTLNVTYLSAHPAYNQRLVLVNRGTREAEFWMDEFQTEPGTTVMSELRGTVPPKSRMVIRVQDHLMVNEGGMTRASGTLNLTAPTDNIDVMTIQVHPGTGQIDTTVY